MDKLLEAYSKKEILFNYSGKDLRFKVSQSLFSSYDVDIGTKRLLRTFILEGIHKYKKVLDLGCGYGPIGIALKSANKSSHVHMVDLDALALAFSRINSELNNAGDIKIYGSLGYDDINDRDFDLIVSNIPAKVGKEVLSILLTDGKYHLVPKGRMAIVIVDAIYDYVITTLSSSKVNILYHKSWPGHHVFHYEFPENDIQISLKKSAWEEGKYIRELVNIAYPRPLNYSIQTTYNLPEFDNPSFDTKLLLTNLGIIGHNKIGRALFFNPGQGYLPVALSKLKKISEIKLVDRNLQSLRSSVNNLVRNGYTPENISVSHQVGMEQVDKKAYGVIIGNIDKKEDVKVLKIFIEQVASLIENDGVVLFASGSTTITRMVNIVHKIKRLRILKRDRAKGRSLLAIKAISPPG